LTGDFDGNVSDRGTVEIKAKILWNQTSLPKNVAEFAPGSRIFESKDEENESIDWNFTPSQIDRALDCIRIDGRERGSCNLRHWVIQGRNEEEKWIQLDERWDDSQLNEMNQIGRFEIANPFRIRILRLRQIGLNHGCDHILAFSAFQLLGDLFGHSLKRKYNQLSLNSAFVCLKSRPWL
jgi:hypothetical protein